MTSEPTNESSQDLRPECDDENAGVSWLVAIMKRLLAPGGCPWDQQQTLQTLRPFLLEECYEVLEALDSGNPAHHCEELGDLLLQIVFQAELAGITMQAVTRSIGEKLIRRHPHVFGDITVRDADEVLVNWEAIKSTEKGNGSRTGALDGTPAALPALHRGHELTRKAARAGFDWPTADDARAKVAEELAEADAAAAQKHHTETHHEIGDLLLAIANWARHLGVEPEQALRDATRRFEQRFRSMEQTAEARGKPLASTSRSEMLELWRDSRPPDPESE